MSAKPAAAAKAPPTEGTAKKGGAIWKFVILGFVVALIGGECLVALMFASSLSSAAADTDRSDSPHKNPVASQTQSQAGESDSEHPANHGDGEAADLSAGDGADEPHLPVTRTTMGVALEGVETDLGDFALTSTDFGSNTTLMINFKLVGIVLPEDETALVEGLENNRARIRQKVIETVRAAELSDLNDPGLGLIKRQILAKVNQTLGAHLLQEVLFSDFVALEQ
jgi:flagellar basal body-associated protein FliL